MYTYIHKILYLIIKLCLRYRTFFYWSLMFLLLLTGIKAVDSEAKSLDLRLSMYVATHTTIKSINHLSELLKVLGKGSKLERLQIHRTKCSKLIANVLAPAILSDLIQDVKECKTGYSLIIDESTDITVNKYMGICIR